jgi:hypothetical protein
MYDEYSPKIYSQKELEMYNYFLKWFISIFSILSLIVGNRMTKNSFFIYIILTTALLFSNISLNLHFLILIGYLITNYYNLH